MYIIETETIGLRKYTHGDDYDWYLCWQDIDTQKGYNGIFDETFDEFCKCLKDCGYIEITDNKGHLEIKCSHHDGTNHFEIKRISDFGWEWYNNHCYY